MAWSATLPDPSPVDSHSFMIAGQPAKLLLNLACCVQHGSTGSLGVAEVSISDAWGNPCNPGRGLEVSLRTAAVAVDGSGRSAKVTARGSNRVRLCEGSGALHDVKLNADTPGEFVLTVTAKSRNMVSQCHRPQMHYISSEASFERLGIPHVLARADDHVFQFKENKDAS
jgi:hypothetical protein